MNLEEVSCLPIKTKRLCNLMRKTAVCRSKAEVIYFDEKVSFFVLFRSLDCVYFLEKSAVCRSKIMGERILLKKSAVRENHALCIVMQKSLVVH